MDLEMLVEQKCGYGAAVVIRTLRRLARGERLGPAVTVLVAQDALQLLDKALRESQSGGFRWRDFSQEKPAPNQKILAHLRNGNMAVFRYAAAHRPLAWIPVDELPPCPEPPVTVTLPAEMARAFVREETPQAAASCFVRRRVADEFKAREANDDE